MKKLVALVLVLMMALAAVSALAEDITGMWYLNAMGIAGGSAEFKEDGTIAANLNMSGESKEMDGTWVVDGDKVTVTIDGDPLEMTIQDGALVNEMGVKFTREPSGATAEAVEAYLTALMMGESPELPEGMTEEEAEVYKVMYGITTEIVGGLQTLVGGMTHEEYVAADLESEVTVGTYVQATQSWWDGKITVYAQSPDGAYFIYNMACSEEDAAKLVPGTAILVTGYKAEWSGEVEITDATFSFVEGAEPFIAEAEDVTALLGTDELINCQNELVAFKGMTVEAYDETGAAFAYKNAENKTDDLYFKVSKDGQTYDFCVEFYLCGQDTEVYKAVEALNVGDVIDLEGFLYWYNGANPHITKITPAE